MNTAIIVAAGSGSRFGGSAPKQFVEVGGLPLLLHTIRKFEQCRSIGSIVVVVAEDRTDEFRATLSVQSFGKPIDVVAGGPTRAASVSNGLNAVADDCLVVAVHDGARPLVEPDEIDRTVAAAAEFGAACLVAAVTDTVKEVDGDFIVSTVDRDRLRRALTPQAFTLEILRRAYEGVVPDESLTDECCLVERIGIRIRAVSGSPRNIKITTPDDLHFAERFLA